MKATPLLVLVEDSEDDVFQIQRILLRSRVANPVRVLRNGEEAIAYLKGEGRYADRSEFPLPRLILLDLKLPGTDGFGVLEWWKDQPELQNIMMVVLSHLDEMRMISRAYRLGARTFLIKPLTVEDVINQTRNFPDYWVISPVSPTASVGKR